MAQIIWEIEPVAYQPRTILYAEELNSCFNTALRVIQGITEAFGDYYGDDNPSKENVTIDETTDASIIRNYIEVCLDNLHFHKTSTYEDRVELAYDQVGGIYVSHSKVAASVVSGVQEMIFNDSGIKITVADDFKVEATGTNSVVELKNNTNTLNLTKNQNELLLNEHPLIYTKTSSELGTNEEMVKKIWYDSSALTIYFE